MLPPMRYNAGDRETVTYFKAVANSTSLPIMVYNNPVDYKIEVTLDMFEELLKCPNIEAVKESTRDISNVTRIKNRFGNRLRIRVVHRDGNRTQSACETVRDDRRQGHTPSSRQ